MFCHEYSCFDLSPFRSTFGCQLVPRLPRIAACIVPTVLAGFAVVPACLCVASSVRICCAVYTFLHIVLYQLYMLSNPPASLPGRPPAPQNIRRISLPSGELVTHRRTQPIQPMLYVRRSSISNTWTGHSACDTDIEACFPSTPFPLQ